MKTHLEALHYKDVHDLRRGYDGQWTGKATQGNVPKTVTIAPDGTVTALSCGSAPLRGAS